MPRVRRQRGAVLVFAMVVLMLVASLAVTMASQLELSARQGGNRLPGIVALAQVSIISGRIGRGAYRNFR